MNQTLSNTKQSFDNIARNYDERDNQNAILQWMRSVVHKVYLQNLPENAKVLELNSGTGIDAVFLADKGMTVYATDISPEMIKVLISNAKAEIAKGMIKAEALSFDEIGNINETGFDAVVSNFGGLNCINDFSRLSGDLAQKLKPGGKFIAVVMNKYCRWEVFYYMLRLDFKKAFRRFDESGIMAELNGNEVLAFYFSPKQFAGYFSQYFSTEKICALAYYTPPPYLIGIYNRLRPLVKLFMKVDEAVKCIFPFNRFGDHFIIVMKKK
jgi:ubiquinone/menaquinone biosynthesis C-methylase UbiE